MSNNVKPMNGGAPAPIANPGNPFNPPGMGVPGPVTQTAATNWMEAVAKALGQRLDQQANKITDLASQITDDGQNQPSTVALLTANAQVLAFLSQSSATTTNSMGEANTTLARKN